MRQVKVAEGTRPSQARAKQLAEECVRVLIEEFGARRALPFGSVRGDSPWHDRSDLDIAVEGLAPELETPAWSRLEDVLDGELALDLILIEEARPAVRARILGEITMPKNNLAALRMEINAEFDNIDRALAKIEIYLPQTDDEAEPEQSLIALRLGDFYQSVERIFERIAVRLDGGLPKGDEWHKELLNGMVTPAPGKRPAVIDADLARRINEYLKFRHRIRHLYGDELEWAKFKHLADKASDVRQQLRSQLDGFLARLETSAN